ncbi:MAG: hypothetical protein O3A10_10150 [Chloroflexi bacterium]|nr:hypothetical protein [Chloroflexota bacterium]MDA1146509.1 hypothetical protein [Chloroflexota bacterium]
MIARTIRTIALGSVAVVLIALVGCRGAEEATPEVTAVTTVSPEVSATPKAPPLDIIPTLTGTPSPTATPPPATPTGLWVFDLARGKRVVLFEGSDLLTSRVEASGNAVTAAITNGDGVTAVRFQPDGVTIEEHANRSSIISTPAGEDRFYLDLSDAEEPRLVLEHAGEEIQLEATRPREGVSFSPSGNRLLTLSVRPTEDEGEEVRTYSVHTTADGRLRMQFEHRARVGTQPVALWSPSGRYIADEGLEGLLVRDTVSGRAWRLGPGGSARWSAGADRLLTITDLGRLVVVSVPELDGVDLGEIDPTAAVQFDRSGRYVVVTEYTDRAARSGVGTRVLDAVSGAEVAAWPGRDASIFAVGGLDPVIALEDGVAAVLAASTGCDGGFVLVHPTLSLEGRCIEGVNPRWAPNGQFLIYAREREVVLLSLSDDSERVIASNTPPANEDQGPLLRWSADGSWILIQWPWGPDADLGALR